MKRLFIVVVCMSMGTVLSGTHHLNVNQELLLIRYLAIYQVWRAIEGNHQRDVDLVPQQPLQQPVVRIERGAHMPKKQFQKKRRCHEIKNNRADRQQHAQINKRIQQPGKRGHK